jgi:hypothetical protein
MTQTASDAGQHVAGVAKDQAANVAGQTKREAKDLLNQGRSQLKDQTSQQQQKAAQSVRSLSDELRGMADQAPSGTASDLVQEVARRASDVAQWLEREPTEVLEDVKGFARRRPGAFLAIALGAGVVVGRLGRSLQAEHSDQQSGTPASLTTTPPPTTGYGTDYGTTGTTDYGTTTAPVAATGTAGLSDPLTDPLSDPLAGGQGTGTPSGAPGFSGPGGGAASAPREGLSGPYDDPLR